MKTSNKILLGGLGIFILSLFSLMIAGRINMKEVKIVEGSGQQKTENRNPGDFSGINISLAGAKVKLIRASIYGADSTSQHNFSNTSNHNIEITADDNLLELVESKIMDETLLIRTRNNQKLRDQNSITINILVEELTYIKVSHSAIVESYDTLFVEDYLSLKCIDSGKIKLLVAAKGVSADIDGAGMIALSGNTSKLNAAIDGSGNIRAGNLIANDVEVDIGGSGFAEVNAATALDVKISGSGNVLYSGDAVVTERISGSGNVKRKNDD